MEALAMANEGRHEVVSATRVRVEAAMDAAFADLDTSPMAAFDQEHPPSEQADQHDTDTENQQQPEHQFPEELRLQPAADHFAKFEASNRDDQRRCRNNQQVGIEHGAD